MYLGYFSYYRPFRYVVHNRFWFHIQCLYHSTVKNLVSMIRCMVKWCIVHIMNTKFLNDTGTEYEIRKYCGRNIGTGGNLNCSYPIWWCIHFFNNFDMSLVVLGQNVAAGLDNISLSLLVALLLLKVFCFEDHYS